MEFIDNKIPKEKLDNIHTSVLAGMSTNMKELVEVNGWDDISSNDEDENIFYIVFFTYVPYTLQ